MTGEGIATVGLQWNGNYGDAGIVFPNTIWCGVILNCSNPPPYKCTGPDRLFFNKEGMTAAAYCLAHQEWELPDPWISETIGPVTITTCVNPTVGAYGHVGPSACTPR